MLLHIFSGQSFFRGTLLALIAASGLFCTHGVAQQIVGSQVNIHRRSSEMRWRRAPDSELSAKVELFVVNDQPMTIVLRKDDGPIFDAMSPQSLVESGQWAWFDMPPIWPSNDAEIPAGAMVVYSFNGASESWGAPTKHRFQFTSTSAAEEFAITEPSHWISSLTFLATDSSGKLQEGSAFPNRLVGHLVNRGAHSVQMQAVRFWTSRADESTPFVFMPGELISIGANEGFPSTGVIGGGESGGFEIEIGEATLGTAVVEVVLADDDHQPFSLWAQIKIKAEHFDISGGWVASKAKGGNSLTKESYLKTLKRMHINTGQIEEVGGYTDNETLYARYPLKRFNRMADLQRYDRDEALPAIHAIEFIGEPQYGGGRPVPPQQVFELLFPYRASRLPTSVTLSEERNWHLYAGLSDFPHYDAYRVIAPAADHWRGYDRWGGQRIAWGAPLETIGEMTRSLREHSRPKPIAYWSQGAHHDWGGLLAPRRGSPTPEELRSQAWHGLGNRITSLYWFNLSLKSLLKFPDLIEPITRVNREIRMLDDFLLRSDAFHRERLGEANSPQWEITSLASADGVLYVVHDLGYEIDPVEKVFRFGMREFNSTVPVPNWLGEAKFLHRIDGSSVEPLEARMSANGLELSGKINVVGLFLLTNSTTLPEELLAELKRLKTVEQSVDFDPAGNAADLEILRKLME